MAARHRTAKAVKNVYRGYMPIGLPQHRPPNRIRPWFKVIGKPMVTIYPKQEIEGYSDEPEYPALNDGSPKGCANQIRYDWYEKLKGLPYLEDKLYEMNHHSFHRMAHISNWLPNYNSLPMAKYLTYTHLIDKALPSTYDRIFDNQDDLPQSLLANDKERFNILKGAILNQIALDKYESFKDNPRYVSRAVNNFDRDQHVEPRFVQNLVNVVKKSLAIDSNEELLSSYQYDSMSAVRSWWYHSGFKQPDNKIFYKSRLDADGNINQMIQMDGYTAVNIRADSFLEPVISMDDPLVTDTSLVEKFNYPLKFYDSKFSFRKPVTLPGFWFEDSPSYDFPHTCFLTTDCLRLRSQVRNYKIVAPLTDDENCLTSQAILTGFGWLNGLSIYHGFTPFQELEYPFTCQLVTTDGQNWMFNVYQMNSHTFHRDLYPIKRNNICWSTGSMQLYREYKDGNFVDVNDEVLKILIKFLSRKPSKTYTSQLNLRPHIKAVDERTDEEKSEMRAKVRQEFVKREDKWLLNEWRVPLFEHIFFRTKETRNKITHMKPRWKVPHKKYPRIFE